MYTSIVFQMYAVRRDLKIIMKTRQYLLSNTWTKFY